MNLIEVKSLVRKPCKCAAPAASGPSQSDREAECAQCEDDLQTRNQQEFCLRKPEPEWGRDEKRCWAVKVFKVPGLHV